MKFLHTKKNLFSFLIYLLFTIKETYSQYEYKLTNFNTDNDNKFLRKFNEILKKKKNTKLEILPENFNVKCLMIDSKFNIFDLSNLKTRTNE